MIFCIIGLGLFSGLGQWFIVDEACYIEWGMKQENVPENWIGMKLLPVLLIREGIEAFGDGMTALWVLKSMFSLAMLVFGTGLFLWLKTNGKPRTWALMTAMLILGTPAIQYGAGRLLSEIPSLAFVVWGLAILGNNRNSPKWWHGIGAGILFIGAYFCRTTSFTLIGSFAATWVTWVAWSWFASEPKKTFLIEAKERLFSPTFTALCVWFVGLLLLHFFSPLPVSPFGTASGHIAVHQREIHANVVAFLAPTGVLGPLVLLLSIVALCLRLCTAQLIFSWIWLILAASPYLYVWLKGAWVLPRHTTDLVLPLAAVIFALLNLQWKQASTSPWRRILALVASLGVITIWGLAHLVMAKWVAWYSHGFQSARGFWAWGALALVVSVSSGILLNKRIQDSVSTNLQSLVLLFLCLGTAIGHYVLGNSAMGVDRTHLNPFALATVLNANLNPGDVICSGGPHYERSLLQFAFPDYAWEFIPVDGDSQIPNSNANRFILLSDRTLIDEPTLFLQSQERLSSNKGTDRVVKLGAYTLYRVE